MTFLGFIILGLAWLATYVLAIPFYIALYATIVFPLAGGCAAVVVLVALFCRGRDKIRGGI